MGTTKAAAKSPKPISASNGIRPDEITEIRYKLRQTRDEFADMIGVNVSTLLAWEKGTQRPDGPALALLRVAAHRPKTVASALGH